jgi:3'-5' exoribonuclease
MSLHQIQNSFAFLASHRFVVTGLQLRITGRDDRVSKQDSPYSVFKLADVTGEATAILWWDKQPWTQMGFSVGDIVNVAGEFINQRDGYLLNINTMSLVDPSAIKPECLLPATWYPESVNDYAMSFCRICNQIGEKALREFIIEVFMHNVTAMGFCNAPASIGYHHSWAGGLLQHSIELANSVYESGACNSKAQSDLAVVVALVHDIGKVATSCGGKRTEVGRHQPHDMSALELLAQPLARLDRHSHEYANVIREFFKPAAWFPKTQSFPVELVHWLDRQGAERGVSMLRAV